jgi:perosamine synthetase
MMKKQSKYVGNELLYLEKVLNSENWSSTTGTWCQTLEKNFASKFDSKHAVAMNSGTSTLHAALEAVGVRAGDEVISPALTVIMDSTATFHANAIPVYADIDPQTFNIDPDDIERKITEKTKAIIIVSLYGLPCEMDRIMEISRKYNIPVIEDNAQCFLSKYKNQLVGTFGAVSSWSLENSKHMSCGEGGIITSNNEKYAELARKVAGHGYKNLRAKDGQIKLNQSAYQDPNYKRHDEIGWNYRLSEICAAVAVAQLENLEQKVKLRKQVANLFINEMSECNYFVQQKVSDHCDHSYFTLGVLYTGEEKIGASWQDFREKYVEFGGDGFYGAWSVPYLEPVISDRKYVRRCPQIYSDVYYKEGLCPVAEQLQPKLMQFKTNYRSIERAKEKVESLKKTINYYKRSK